MNNTQQDYRKDEVEDFMRNEWCINGESAFTAGEVQEILEEYSAFLAPKIKQEAHGEIMGYAYKIYCNSVPGLRIYRDDGSGISFMYQELRRKFQPRDEDFIPSPNK